MVSAIKQFISVFFLLLFLFNVAGYYLLFIGLDKSNRNSMQEYLLHTGSMEEIRIHKSDLKNIVFKDQGREFLYHEEMYDVKSRAESGDYIVFHCKRDAKETRLLAGLDKMVHYQADSNTEQGKKQNHASKNPVKDLFIMISDSPLTQSNHFVYRSYRVSRIANLAFPLPSPPPEVL